MPAAVPNRIVPCLWFDDAAEEAAQLYTGLFAGGRVLGRSYYPQAMDNPGQKPRGSLLTVEFEVAGQHFTALNGGPQFSINPSISFFVQLPNAEDVKRLYAGLERGGSALMPLGAYAWSKCYAWVQDRFGVSWQLMTVDRDPGSPTIVPCFMFAGPVHRRAEEALALYTRVFPGGRVLRLERYAEGEGPVDTVKHGRFTIAGHELVVMDAHGEHPSTFDEGLSLQVMCEDQAELDRYWEQLSEGGSKGPCGWLKDRFGVSWQITPRQMTDLMMSPDAAARDRAFAAMLDMGKLDLAVLQQAFRGT